MRIKKVHWDEIKGEIKEVNQGLFELLNSGIKPKKGKDKRYFYDLKYHYSDFISKNGKFGLPGTNLSVNKTINYEKLTEEEFQLFDEIENSYSSHIPLCLIMTGKIEIFLNQESNNELIPTISRLPLSILDKGDLFGLFEVLDSIHFDKSEENNSIWNVSAGLTTLIFDLPSQDKSFKNAFSKMDLVNGSKEKDFKKYISQDLSRLVRIIEDNNVETENKWYTRILLIPDYWVKEIQVNDLMNFLYSTGWEQSKYLRNELVDFNKLYPIIKSSDKKIQPAVIRHLIRIFSGNAPGFAFSNPKKHNRLFKLAQSVLKELSNSDSIQPILVPEIIERGESGFWPFNLKFNQVRNRSSNVHKVNEYLEFFDETGDELKDIELDLLYDIKLIIGGDLESSSLLEKSKSSRTGEYLYQDLKHLSSKLENELNLSEISISNRTQSIYHCLLSFRIKE